MKDTSTDVAAFGIDLIANDVSTIRELHSKEDGWPGEWWLNTKSANVRKIMVARMDLAKSKGCDAVDPDNVDGFSNDTGFSLSNADSIGYLKFLAEAAHCRGLAIGLKNAGDKIPQIVGQMEFAAMSSAACTTSVQRRSHSLLLENLCSTSNTQREPRMWTRQPQYRFAVTLLPKGSRLC